MKTKDQTIAAQEEIVTLFVKVAAKPGSADTAREALNADVNGARTESGNYKMELYQVEGDTDNFYLIERWQNQAQLEYHFSQPYTAGAFALQKNDLNEPIQMNYLTDLWPTAQNLQKETHRPLTTLIVPFEIKPGSADAFISLWQQFVPAVRNEPGNVDFHFHRVNGSETTFVLYERWENQSDLDAHNQLATTAEMIDAITPLLSKPVMEFILFVKDRG